MFELFSQIKNLIKKEPVRIDNVVFRLHSRATVILLATCAIIVTAKQYFGEPITCIPDQSIAKEPVNAYCWIYSTFTVYRHLDGIPGKEVAAPGVGPVYQTDEILYHRYYQWVCFVLALQAILFYTPRALWGVWEAGIVGHLTKDLATPLPGDAWSDKRKRQLVQYFAVTTIHTHNFYAFRFLICELLNFLNAIGQIYVLDVFLEGQFRNYGAAVTAFASETKPFERIDPMARLFPKVTKCTIHKYGPSGSTVTIDALCVLPLNVVNEKIFVFVWFWLIFLAGVSALAICYRIIVFTQPWVRMYLLRASTRVLLQTKANVLSKYLKFGDWFLLYQLAHNVNPIVYRELVNEIAGALTDKCVVTCLISNTVSGNWISKVEISYKVEVMRTKSPRQNVFSRLVSNLPRFLLNSAVLQLRCSGMSNQLRGNYRSDQSESNRGTFKLCQLTFYNNNKPDRITSPSE